MTFSVTYRGKDGALREECVEAADRAGCVAECRRRGIAATKIAGGGRTSARAAAAGGGGRRTAARWAVAVLAAVTVGGGAWWWAARPESAPRQAGKPAKPKAAARGDSRPPRDSRPPVGGAADGRRTGKGGAARADARPLGGGDTALAVTNAPGTNGVVWIVPPLEPDDPDNALRTRTAQELGSILSVTPGDPIPPFPYSFLVEDDQKRDGQPADNGNGAFLESLRKLQIRAKETDSESVSRHKEDIVTAQMDLLDGIKEGLSVNDSIRAAYEFRVRAHEYRNSAVAALREWAAENPARADFDKALADMNAKLSEEGIKTIPAEEVVPELEEEVQEPKEKSP